MIFSQELRLEVTRNFLTVKILNMAANKSFFVYVLHLLEMNTIYKKQNSLMIFKNIILCQNLGVKSCLCQLLMRLSFLICKMGISNWNVMKSCSTLCNPMQPTKLLCPQDSPGKNTGVGCLFLLQQIFPTQGLNLDLPHCRQILNHNDCIK